MDTLEILIQSDEIRAKVLRNLQVIGKRAKGGDGGSLFSMVTYSANEAPVFDDMVLFGAENLVSELSDVASSYATTGVGGVSIVLASDRWKVDSKEEDMKFDLTSALVGMFSTYLYNFCLSRFLDMAFPDNRYSKSYSDHCALIVMNIKTLAFLKRPDNPSAKSYGDVKMSEDSDDDEENKEKQESEDKQESDDKLNINH